jgi:hypothetical protein
MEKIKFRDISLVNAGFADLERMSLGCQGVILIGDEFAEIHVVCSGFSAETENEGYLAINKTVISTSSRYDAINVFKRSIEITGTRYAANPVDFSISKWLGAFSGASGGSLDLLSSDEKCRTLALDNQASSVLFTIAGARIRLERRGDSTRYLPFDSNGDDLQL